MRPVFTERQLGLAGSFADLGFFRGGCLWEPEQAKRARRALGGLGLRENEISAFVS